MCIQIHPRLSVDLSVDIPVAFYASVAFCVVLIVLVRLGIDPEPILVLHDVLFLEIKLYF